MGNRNLEASLRASVTPTFEVSRILKDLDADRKEPFGPKRGWRWKDKARNAPRLEFKPGPSPHPDRLPNLPLCFLEGAQDVFPAFSLSPSLRP